jgi:hypothetical protein
MNLSERTISLIENGTILSDLQKGCLSPQINIRKVSQEELNQIKSIIDNVGRSIKISDSWISDYYLYNSPNHGLIIVYNSVSILGINYGWYSITPNILLFNFYL